MKKEMLYLLINFTFDKVTIVEVHFSHSYLVNGVFFSCFYKNLPIDLSSKMVSILREPAGLRASKTREPDCKKESHGLAGSL